MTTDKSATDVLTIELTKLLTPLRHLNSVDRVKRMLYEVGVDLTAISDSNQNIQTLVTNLGPLVSIADELVTGVTQLISAETEQEELEAIAALALLIPDTVRTIYDVVPTLESSITNALPNIVNEIQNLAQVLPVRIVNYLLYLYLQNYYKRIYSVLHVLGILETEQFQGETYAIKTIQWERLPLLFSDPMELADDVYSWNEGPDTFEGDKFLDRIEVLLRAFILHGGIYTQDDAIRAQFGRVQPGDDREIRMPIYQTGVHPESHVELDINLSPIPSDGNRNAGLALYPYLTAGFNMEQELAENWVLTVAGNLDPGDAGFGVKLRAPHDLELIDGIFSGNPVDSALQHFDARFELGIRRTSTPGSLSYIFGTEDASHLALREAGAKLIIALQENVEEVAAELEVQELTLAINPAQGGDGFIQKILSGINIKVTSDLLLGVSNLEGFYFRGSGGLEIAIPIHEDLGPIHLETLYVTLNVDGGFELVLAATFGLELGPLAGSVEKIGLIIPIDFPAGGDGNLGPVQVDFPGFKPPTGAGFSIDTGGLIGGGFLEIDDPNKRYAGILALQFGEIGIVAIALITTRMPDGSDGFSMLVNIGVTFDPGFQLSMGFTLLGIGGLFGINRAIDIDALISGIKNRTLDSILFPDPSTVIANANKIISDLRAVFPPADGQFVIGPMVKIGYGTPTLISADIGIFVQFPEPIRIVLLGQVAMALPEERQPIVQVHLDVLGVLDFDKDQLVFLASLYDSSILEFVLSGDAAFLLSWGDDPQFAMSLGGFHPKFTPPPPPIIFADLRRLSLGLSSGSSFQLTCASYQALTPNSLQFGARVDLYARGGGAVVTGYLGFDALIFFSPFSFEVSIGGGVVIKINGHTLADVDIFLALSGPTPWDARGKAKIKILFIDVDAGFHVTWGSRDQKTLPPVDPWGPMQNALREQGNWSGVLPRHSTMVEVIRPFGEGETQPFVVHPGGFLEIRQKIAPIGVRLFKSGNAPVTGHDAFVFENVIVDNEEVPVDPVEEFFARGQVEDLNAQQQLSVPSFEKFQGGVRSRASSVIKIEGIDDQAANVIEESPLFYESILLRPDRISEKQEQSGTLSWREANTVSRAKHRRQAAHRSGSRKKFGELRTRAKVRTQEERYCIARLADLTRAELSDGVDQVNYDLSRAAADQLLEDHLQRVPDDRGLLMVVPEYELEEAA